MIDGKDNNHFMPGHFRGDLHEVSPDAVKWQKQQLAIGMDTAMGSTTMFVGSPEGWCNVSHGDRDAFAAYGRLMATLYDNVKLFNEETGKVE